MAGSLSEPMPQTVEAYKELLQRDLDFWTKEMESKNKEMSALKKKVNDLQQGGCLKEIAENRPGKYMCYVTVDMLKKYT